MEEKKLPGLAISLFPILLLIASIFFGIKFLGCSPHIPMLMTTIVTALVGLIGLKRTWVLSGVVPTMIYFGLSATCAAPQARRTWRTAGRSHPR